MNLRNAIKAKHPGLLFKIRKVDFTDLARESSTVFIESNAWGMTKGNHELYQSVKAIAEEYGAITSW